MIPTSRGTHQVEAARFVKRIPLPNYVRTLAQVEISICRSRLLHLNCSEYAARIGKDSISGRRGARIGLSIIALKVKVCWSR